MLGKITKVNIASDHAGFELKNEIVKFLEKEGYEVDDCGPHAYDPDDDYPDFCAVAATKTAENSNSRGIVLGKSGAGECIVANKVRGIRAFLAMNEKNVRLAREHNDANVMSIGSDFLPFEEAKKLILLFLESKFPGDKRHVRRIRKISELEQA